MIFINFGAGGSGPEGGGGEEDLWTTWGKIINEWDTQGNRKLPQIKVRLSITLQGKYHLCIPLLGIAQPQSQYPHSCVCERFIISQGSVHIFPWSRTGRPILEIYKSLRDIHECRNLETEHYNSVLEITVSFLGIQRWELDIYIGFSPVLHLLCMLPGPVMQFYLI